MNCIRFTRCITGNYDDIVGVVNLKNIFAHIDDDDFNLSDLMTEALYDGTDDGIQSLERFKTTGVHYAMVG
jgi:putative hemolysin